MSQSEPRRVREWRSTIQPRIFWRWDGDVMYKYTPDGWSLSGYLDPRHFLDFQGSVVEEVDIYLLTLLAALSGAPSQPLDGEWERVRVGVERMRAALDTISSGIDIGTAELLAMEVLGELKGGA